MQPSCCPHHEQRCGLLNVARQTGRKLSHRLNSRPSKLAAQSVVKQAAGQIHGHKVNSMCTFILKLCTYKYYVKLITPHPPRRAHASRDFDKADSHTGFKVAFMHDVHASRPMPLQTHVGFSTSESVHICMRVYSPK